MTAAPRKALMLFHDDSSLIVCRGLADQIAPLGWRPEFAQFILRAQQKPKISERQLKQGLGPWPLSHRLIGTAASRPAFLAGFDLVASAKYPRLFREYWARGAWRFGAKRPCFAGFFPGLEFFPENGFENRKYADLLCFNNRSDLALYESFAPSDRPKGQRLIRYQPNLLRRPEAAKLAAPPDSPLAPLRKIVFFTQSIAPESRLGREQALEFLVALARAQPQAEVLIKLRHLPQENRAHTHVELYSYGELLEALASPPPNLRLFAGSLDASLAGTDLALTCSSTAGLESLARGIPTLFLLDYEGAAEEPIAQGMARFLKGSGLSVARDWTGSPSPQADPLWLDDALSAPSDAEIFLEQVEAFLADPPPLRRSPAALPQDWWLRYREMLKAWTSKPAA